MDYNDLVGKLNSVGSEILRLHQTRRGISDVDSGDREALKSPIRSLETGPKHVEEIALGEGAGGGTAGGGARSSGDGETWLIKDPPGMRCTAIFHH